MWILWKRKELILNEKKSRCFQRTLTPLVFELESTTSVWKHNIQIMYNMLRCAGAGHKIGRTTVPANPISRSMEIMWGSTAAVLPNIDFNHQSTQMLGIRQIWAFWSLLTKCVCKTFMRRARVQAQYSPKCQVTRPTSYSPPIYWVECTPV